MRLVQTPRNPHICRVYATHDYVAASDGARIFYRNLCPEGARAAVIILHGYQEHGGRYQHVQQYLARRGFASWVPDHRGHGRTAVVPGYMPSVDMVVCDLWLFREMIARDLGPDVPVFLLGHSMGGLITICHLERYQTGIAGAVVTGPAVMVPPNVSGLVQAISGLAGRLVPRLGIQPFFDPK